VGATGNVGTALLHNLKDDPAVDHIVGIARRTPGVADTGFGGKVTWVEADIVTDDLGPALSGADAVVNLAWQIQPAHDRGQMHLTNVHGSRRVFDAALLAGVAALVQVSSVGTYSKGPKDRAVSEDWPHTGVPTSSYSRDKATVEAMLDRLEAAHPSLRVVRLRPALIFQRAAATEISHYFLGRLVPRSLVQPRRLPIVPLPAQLRFQAVHADDVAVAVALALTSDVRGAFNLAADPVLDVAELARLFDARPVTMPVAVLRRLVDLTYRLRLQPTDAGWIDMAAQVPLMDVTRAHVDLGWTPRVSANSALLDLTDGIRDRETGPTPALR
jgi:UDP-glucose 4-epimerase